jgi:fumarylpyruvate hydrolase
VNSIDRRTVLASGALALAAAQAAPAEAQTAPKPIFPVPMTTISIVGETAVF